MSSEIDDLAAAIRRDAEAAAAQALAAIATAGATALAVLAVPAFAHAHSTAGGDGVADVFVKAFKEDLLGQAASEIDRTGVPLDGASVVTQLVAFASGENVRSPIGDMSVEHPFEFPLPPVHVGGAALETLGTLTVRGACRLDDATGALTKTTTAKISFELSWSTEGAGEANA